MNLIILNGSFLTNTDVEKYGINLFTQKNIKVENWTLLYLIPEKYLRENLKKIYIGKDNKNFENKLLKNYSEVINKINSLSSEKTVYVSNCNFNSKQYLKICEILYYLKKNNKIIIGFELSSVPLRVKNINFLKLIYEHRKNLFSKIIKRFKKIKLNGINFKSRKIYHNFYFICGKKSLNKNFIKLFDKRLNKIIYSCSYDYSRFINFDKNNIKSLSYDYSLFIDEFNLFHPDINYHKDNRNPIVNKNYYIEIKNFLNYYEKITKNKVIIAKHPKNYMKNLYDRFEISNIFEYINNAKDIIANCSNAVNIAVLNKKNVLFLNSKSYSNEYQKSINLFAKALLQKEIFIDDINNYSNVNFDYQLSIKQYDRYIEDFINASGQNSTHVENIYNTIFK